MALKSRAIEIPLFFTTFGLILTVTITSNLLMYRACYILENFNKTECAKLGFIDDNSTEYLEQRVEPIATRISLIKSISESILGSILALVIAPWSDRFGRKPILILGQFGGMISMIFYIIFAGIETLSPWYLLLMVIPIFLTGGTANFIAVVSAYLADSTKKEERAFRMGIFDVILTLALLLANSASPYILVATNYVVVYCISFLCHLVGLIYTIFFIEESLINRETENAMQSIFVLRNFTEMITTPFKRRENSKRTIILLILAGMLVSVIPQSSASLLFFFVRDKMHWTLTQFTWYGSITNILGIFGTLIIVYFFHTLFKIQETALIFCGLIFSVVSSISFGFAVKDWQIYFGAILNLPGAANNALMRSLISKLVNEEEVAKMFSAFGIASTILIPLSAIGFTGLYDATLNTDPGLYNFVNAGFIFVASVIFCLVWMILLQIKRNSAYSILQRHDEEVTE